jgi:hypothetical protein
MLCGALPVAAQQNDGVSITVAPTLIELGLAPGEVWQSSIKVVNTNTFPLTIFAEPAHFAPVGDRGVGSVVPRGNIPADENVLANWVSLDTPTVTINPNASVQVPFVVTAPDDATPGSHFAAIQISTVPPSQAIETGVATAQVISSLLFVRVAGAIEESAAIRSFTASNAFSTEPQTDITLRVENFGNVHVRPVGEILIRNMWGGIRGTIPVNVNTSFGNTLPGTIRTYDYQWRRAPSLLDIGRYSAKVSLAYGTEARQFATSETSFWVIPVRPLLVLVGIILSVILFIFAVSRWYVRLLLRQAGVTSLSSVAPTTAPPVHAADDLDLSIAQTTADTEPRTSFYSSVWQKFTIWQQRAHQVWQLMPQRAHLVVGSVILLGLLSIVALVLSNRQTSNFAFETTIGSAETAVTYNSEEIAFFQQPGMTPQQLVHDTAYAVQIINASRTPGAAGVLAATLVDRFPVTAVGVDTAIRRQSVIVFPLALQAEAEALSAAIPGALLSVTDEATTTVSVFIGE